MKNVVISAVLACVLACSSSSTPIDSPSPVLEPADAATNEAPIEAPAAPSLGPLQVKLGELGYEGVGLELESESVLAVLVKVFSDPAARDRKVMSVYTGGANAYDPSSESLTLGGTRDVKAILTFIKKKVPVRPKRKG